jgi:polyisoprenoid-binding protein YceI
MKTFAIDKLHSEATFQVRHLVTKVRGRFSDFAGTIQFDEARPEQGSVQFTVQAASIDTNAADRDVHLRSEDFFHVEKFPTITFASTRIVAKGANEFNVTGALTIRGVTKEVTLPVAYLGRQKDPWGNEKAGFETEITINRKDFGLLWNAGLETGGFLVGDDVKISISIQAAAQQAVTA